MDPGCLEGSPCPRLLLLQQKDQLSNRVQQSRNQTFRDFQEHSARPWQTQSWEQLAVPPLRSTPWPPCWCERDRARQKYQTLMVQGTQRLTQKLAIAVRQRVPANIVLINKTCMSAPAPLDIPHKLLWGCQEAYGSLQDVGKATSWPVDWCVNEILTQLTVVVLTFDCVLEPPPSTM